MSALAQEVVRARSRTLATTTSRPFDMRLPFIPLAQKTLLVTCSTGKHWRER
jgi:hypothetical protein